MYGVTSSHVLGVTALRNAIRMGWRSYTTSSSPSLPRAWTPTPYVTETVVCATASTLPLDADFAGRWLAHMYASSPEACSDEEGMPAEPPAQMIFSRDY